jgi:hypothetical protein
VPEHGGLPQVAIGQRVGDDLAHAHAVERLRLNTMKRNEFVTGDEMISARLSLASASMLRGGSCSAPSASPFKCIAARFSADGVICTIARRMWGFGPDFQWSRAT